MKKIIFILALLVVFGVEVFGKQIGQVYSNDNNSREIVLKSLEKCDYVVDFKLYSYSYNPYDYRQKRLLRVPSYLDRLFIKRTSYDRYHKNRHYNNNDKKIIIRIPSRGYIKISYAFINISGKIMARGEKVYNTSYHQEFPSRKVTPRECLNNRYYYGDTSDKFRDGHKYPPNNPKDKRTTIEHELQKLFQYK